jgi:AbrB family looped-hinge helix DNA binding protein
MDCKPPARATAAALYVMLECKVMAQATVSSKNQIVIPREAREALGLKAGDKVLVVVRGKRVLVLQKPRSHRAAIRGLAGTAYPSRHLHEERQSWE